MAWRPQSAPESPGCPRIAPDAQEGSETENLFHRVKKVSGTLSTTNRLLIFMQDIERKVSVSVREKLSSLFLNLQQ